MKGILVLLAIFVFISANPDAQKVLKVARQELPADLVLKEPVPPGNDLETCQGLWGRTGFVCAKEGLKKFSDSDQATIKVLMEESVVVGNDILQLVKDMNAENTGTHEYSEVQEKIVEWQGKKEQTDKCWNSLAKVRNSALCLTCSNENYNYFMGKKEIISMESCSSLLQDCSDGFQFLKFLTRGLQYGMDYPRLMEEKGLLVPGIASHAKAEFEKHQHSGLLIKIIGFIQMMTSINYGPEAEETDQRRKVSTQICERVIRVRQASFLGIMLSILKQGLAGLRLMVDTLHKTLVKTNTGIDLNAIASNWGALGRFLNTNTLALGNIKQILEGDVLVQKILNHNIQSNSVVQNPQHHKPMNLSLSFP